MDEQKKQGLTKDLQEFLADAFRIGENMLQANANFNFTLDLGLKDLGNCLLYEPKLIQLNPVPFYHPRYQQEVISLSSIPITFYPGVESFLEESTEENPLMAGVISEDSELFVANRSEVSRVFTLLCYRINQIERKGQTPEERKTQPVAKTVSIQNLDSLMEFKSLPGKGHLVQVAGPLIELPNTYRTETPTEQQVKYAIEDYLSI